MDALSVKFKQSHRCIPVVSSDGTRYIIISSTIESDTNIMSQIDQFYLSSEDGGLIVPCDVYSNSDTVIMDRMQLIYKFRNWWPRTVHHAPEYQNEYSAECIIVYAPFDLLDLDYSFLSSLTTNNDA